MNRILLTLCIIMLMTTSSFTQQKFNPPPTKIQPVTDILHNFKITDNYRWLEDKDNPEVKEWSHKQTDYTKEFINSTCLPIEGFKDEIRSFIDRDYTGAPFFKGKREFYYKKAKGEKQNKLFTRINGKEILIFDPVKFDSSGKTALSGFDLTDDGNRAAIGTQFKGDEINTYMIIDTKNGKVIGEQIKNVFGFSWTQDEKSAYITYRSKEDIIKQNPLKTYLHKLGDDPKNDKFLAAPGDAKNSVNIWDTDEGGLTFFSEGDFYSNTLKVRKQGSAEDPVLIYSSSKFKTTPTVKNNRIFFYTNYEAPNFKIMVAEIDKPDFKDWKEFYPQKKSILKGFTFTNDYMIVLEKKNVLSTLSVYDLNGKFIKDLNAPELGDISGLSYHKETNTVYVSLNTFTAPSKMYKLDGKTLEWTFFYQDKTPYNTDEIESKLVFYPSKDGTQIPLFIVNKKGIKLDGTNPTLIYGYGGFNISMGPGFLGTTTSFVNRGGVYAIACLRGGDEYGENWHLNGMLHKKQNTFDDFIAGAEYLIKEKYTNPQKLAVRGGSNGGLLIGATITQRPDLFKAAICAVPLLDMIRYHKFLIARYWIPEYGSSDNEEDFRYILQYSPYQNIRTGLNLPPTLVKTGENDSRVDPLHAKKFVAALQNNPGQLNPIMLYIDFDSGHGSGQSIDQQVNNIELEWRWVMTQLGIK